MGFSQGTMTTMDKITFRFDGASALLMHSDRGVNPLDPDAARLKALTSTRKKTDEIHAQVARLEWELGMYYDAEFGPHLPTANLRGVLVEGAKFAKMGATVKRATIVEDDRAKLNYEGPRELEAMWKSGEYRDIRSVVVGTARVMRCRPKFRKWSVEFTLLFDTESINRDALITAAEAGGRLIGLGDFRPSNGGPFGRFTVTAS
jgi:hypothetical protein